MKVEDAEKYQGYEEIEVKIARFLDEHKGTSYTEDEIKKGIGEIPMVYTKDEKGSYWTWENAGKFAVDVANSLFFRDTLNEMVKKKRIKASEVGKEKYYYAYGKVAGF